ncbi:MAG: VanZ family protein [Gammaproteobacteria bacterium]
MFIPLLSYYGRSLQNLLNQIIAMDKLGILLTLLLLTIVLMAARWLHQSNPSKLWLTLFWFVPLFIVIPMMLPIAIERMHFIVFGIFGFVSLLLWNRVPGLLLCGLVAGMDELFQWWLPDRVGDLRDVLINMLAVYGGALFAMTGKNRV